MNGGTKLRLILAWVMVCLAGLNMYSAWQVARLHNHWRDTMDNLIALDVARDKPNLSCNVIHFPKNGMCPDRWTPIVDLFTWHDGTKFPGCVDYRNLRKTGNVRVDILLGGEKLSVPLDPQVSEPMVPQT
jgi:hypothetical protein